MLILRLAGFVSNSTKNVYKCDACEPIIDRLIGLIVAQMAGGDFSFGDVRHRVRHF